MNCNLSLKYQQNISKQFKKANKIIDKKVCFRKNPFANHLIHYVIQLNDYNNSFTKNIKTKIWDELNQD